MSILILYLTETSAGHIRGDKSMPSELRGRVALINGHHSYKDTRTHEMEHMRYRGFVEDIREGSLETTERINARMQEIVINVREEGGGFAQEIHAHQAYAREIVKDYMRRAKNETIAYLAAGDSDYRRISQLGGKYFLNTLEAVKIDFHNNNPHLSSEEYAAAYGVYADAFSTYLDQLRQYQFMARRLDLQGRLGEQGLDIGGIPITREKAKALLQITSPENIQRLSPYLGATDKELTEAFAQEQSSLVAELHERMATGRLLNAQGEGEDVMEKLIAMYPEKALPALLKIIDGSYKPDDDYRWSVVASSITASCNILHMHARGMTAEQLREVRDTLGTVLTREPGYFSDNADWTREQATALINYIDENAAFGIIEEHSLRDAVALAMRTPEGERPSVDQVVKLVSVR